MVSCVDTVSCELEACDRSCDVECFRSMQSLFFPTCSGLVSNWGWQVKCWAKHASIIHSLVLGWGKSIHLCRGAFCLKFCVCGLNMWTGAGDTWAAPIGQRSLTSVMLASFFLGCEFYVMVLILRVMSEQYPLAVMCVKVAFFRRCSSHNHWCVAYQFSCDISVIVLQFMNPFVTTLLITFLGKSKKV